MGKVLSILIIGGGLAGSCAALQLAKRGLQTEVAHQNSIAVQTASMVPLALYNPAAALRAKKGWRAEECHKALHGMIDELTEFLGHYSFVSKTGVLRPSLDEEMALHFKKSAETEGWPEGWVSWLEPGELKERFPESEHRWGGLWVQAGMTFDTPALIKGLHQMLTEKYACRISERKVVNLDESKTGVEVRFEDGSAITAESVLLAAGASSKEIIKPVEFNLHPVKGQTIEIKRFLPETFSPSVSSRGYVSLHSHRVVVGSTYEHHFKDLNPTAQSAEFLLKKVPKSFPGVRLQQLSITKSWAGIRLTTPDRLPLLGLIPGKKRIYFSSGFGSKGIMFAPYCGICIADHICNGNDLFPETDLHRQVYH
ncbi:MAG: FAD-binding oxidoreductase [Candidatus Cyclonatronum sp.]|uniref:NAD(P)/FAD-dependent oxidoreductase n=1 Tax=Cyclonatronum sp. TaxID=3024185 RepID=UPI0025C6626A|nr:FAD-binding oxidoreductase [Cyclonatronum sp.]MCH8486463.1 FAD-binding oxidoreductase [Cyclonatronum sp.]